MSPEIEEEEWRRGEAFAHSADPVLAFSGNLWGKYVQLSYSHLRKFHCPNNFTVLKVGKVSPRIVENTKRMT